MSKDLIATDPTRYYLVCVIDACTRLAWAEVVTDLKSLTVMFSALKSFTLLHQRYQLQFAEVLTDNGSERGGLGNLNTGDKWHFCSQSAFLPFTRRDYDETSTPEP